MRNVLTKCFFYIVCSIIAGYLLLVLAYCIPLNDSKVEETYQIVDQEGWYPIAPLINSYFDSYFRSYEPAVVDNGTVRSTIIRKTFNSGSSPFLLAADDYQIYWHGYVTILRPLFYFLNLYEIQLLCSFFSITLMLFISFTMGKKLSLKYLVVLVLSFLMLMPIAISSCLQYMTVFVTTYITALIIIMYGEGVVSNFRYVYIMLFCGIATSYLDLLTYPIVAYAIPTFFIILFSTEEDSVLYYLKISIYSGLSWLSGYACMWMGKWIISSVVLRRNVIVEAISEALYRSGTDDSFAYGVENRLYSLFINWKHYNFSLYALIFLITLAVFVIGGCLFGYKKDNRIPAILLTGSSGALWYIVLCNHTGIHHFFTYRNYNTLCTAFFFIVAITINIKGKPSFNIKKKYPLLIIYCISCVISIGLVYMTKEINEISNRESGTFEKVLFTEENSTFKFEALFDSVKQVAFGLYTDNKDGYYEFLVKNNNEVVYVETVSAEKFASSYYSSFLVDWSLDSGAEYEVTINEVGLSEPSYLLYSSVEASTIPGLHYIDENGNNAIAQPLITFFYWGRVVANETQMRLFMTYWGVLVLFSSCAWIVLKKENR